MIDDARKGEIPMFRKTTILAAFALSVLFSQVVGAAEANAPASAWVSEDAIVVLEVSQPKALLDRILTDKLMETVTAHPAYKKATSEPGFQHVKNLVQYFERKYDTDWKTILGKLIGGGITLAIGPNETNLVIVDAEDAKMLDEIHEFILLMTKTDAQNKGQPDKVASVEYRGVTAWRFGPNEAHVIVDNRLLLSNKPEALVAALDLRADASGASLAKLPTYQAAKGAVGSNPVASIFVKTGLLKQLPQIAKGLEQNDRNPLVSLLFAPLITAVKESTWLATGVSLDGETLTFDVVTDGAPRVTSGPESFATPSDPNGGALPNVSVPRQIAAVSFYRDLHKFYASKDELFPERTSGLIFFENMMGIFFTGKDLTDEVLAETTPEVRLVVAEQQYDPKIGAPETKIPGFALVLRLKDPAKFQPIAEEAWQKGLGLINFTRGQNAEPGLIIDRPTHGDVKYTMSSFSAAGEEDKTALDMRFNFQPSLAMPADYLILSSTDGLAKDLIDDLKEEKAGGVKAVPGVHSMVELDATQLGSILEANREALIRNNMVEEGHTREQAESELGVLMMALEYLGDVKLIAGVRDGQSRVRLQVDLNLPQ